MNYPLRSRKREGGSLYRVIFVVFFFLCFIFILNSYSPNFFSGTFQVVGRPFWLVKNWTAERFDGFFSYFSSKQSLEAQNNDLRNQLLEQNIQIQNLSLQGQENEDLKNSFSRSNKKTLIMAAVLQGPGFSPYDTFIIDQGTDANVRIGNRVYVYGSLPIGFIKNVYQTSSLVELYSSPGEQVDVVVGAQKVLAVATGRGDGNFEISLPQNLGIDIGSTVTLPSITPELLGTITSKESDVAHALQTFYFRTDFNLNSVRSVYIDSQSIVPIKSMISTTTALSTTSSSTTKK